MALAVEAVTHVLAEDLATEAHENGSYPPEVRLTPCGRSGFDRPQKG